MEMSMPLECSSRFQWRTPTPPLFYSYKYNYKYKYSLPQIAKDHAQPNRKLHIKLKAALRSENEIEEEKEKEKEKEDEDGDFQVVTAIESSYNRIVIIDTPKSRLLLLDSTNNVHSMINKESKWTHSYWDECATFPPLLPKGPIAIFGLGGGTSANLMLDLWPSLQLEGWEIDGILIDQSREYFGLDDLEKHNADGGVLNVHIGDVFSPEATISGGYSGIIVDLFSDGKVLPQLEQASTWLELSDRLMGEGRFMVNCGAGEKGEPDWKLNATIRALCEAFPGKVSWKKLPQGAGENYVALTGFLPDLTTWSAAVPDELKSSVNQWRTCDCVPGS